MSSFRAVVLVVFAGCAGNVSDLDDAGADAGAGAVADAGPAADAGAVADAGLAADAGVGADAGLDDDAGVAADAGAEPPLVTRTFSPSDAGLLNPERGFYDTIDLLSADPFSSTRAAGHTLALAGVRLDAFRTSPIDAPTLTALSAGLARARTAGIKVILRFQYNDGPIGAADASRTQILSHLAQLRPVLQANADVIAVMQAGLIGAWGEWHSSTNGLDETTQRSAILHGLLDALPTSRMVQVRTPNFVDDLFPGGPLTSALAFTGVDRARVGHHNDCFLASDSDFGTYPSPIDTWKTYVATDARWVPTGGETCAVFAPRSECPSAKAELERLHYRFLNSEYHLGVLGSWRTGGCLTEIENRLGYRLVLEQLEHSREVRPGGLLRLRWKVRNDGYGALFNERPLELVLEQGATRLVARVDVDVRRWEPGAHEVAVRLRVPATLAPGTYRLSLALPDAEPSLRARAEYAVQLANEGVWAAGVNVLVPALTVSDSAGGVVDPAATQFVEVP